MRTYFAVGMLNLLIALLPSYSFAEECKLATFIISGTLLDRAANIYTTHTELRDSDRPTIRIPLDLVGAADTALFIRLSRADESTWIVELADLIDSVQKEQLDYNFIGLDIRFNADGTQELAQSFSFTPVSNDPIAAQSTVVVIFRGLEISADESRLMVSDSRVSLGECIVQGKVDIANEADGGRHREVRYYPPGDNSPMLNDRPAEALTLK